MIEHFNTLFKKLWKVSSPNSDKTNQTVAIQTNFAHKNCLDLKTFSRSDINIFKISIRANNTSVNNDIIFFRLTDWRKQTLGQTSVYVGQTNNDW